MEALDSHPHQYSLLITTRVRISHSDFIACPILSDSLNAAEKTLRQNDETVCVLIHPQENAIVRRVRNDETPNPRASTRKTRVGTLFSSFPRRHGCVQTTQRAERGS